MSQAITTPECEPRRDGGLVDRLRRALQQTGEYLFQVWDRRHFWLALAYLDVKRKYRRTNIGMAWALVPPLAMATLLSIVFHRFFEVGILEYIPKALVGLCFWNYFTNVLHQGCVCIFMSETYIRQTRAPLAIYPLRAVLASGFHFLLVLLVAGLFHAAVNGLANPLALLQLLPTFLLFFLFGWAVAIILGFLNVYIPDTWYCMEVGLNLLFYATPIMYTREMIEKKNMAWIIDWNPLTSFVMLLRDPILEGRCSTAQPFAVAGLTVLVAALLAVLTVAKCERQIIFRL